MKQTKSRAPFGLRIGRLGAGMLALTVFTSCAELSDEWGDETTQAAAVGGVMGAGLGAIIGSQTGSAGAGLAIGGLAGAGAGAAVGSVLQERSDELRVQEEQIERQQRRITASRRRLAEMEAARDDSLQARVSRAERATGSRSDPGSRLNTGSFVSSAQLPFRSSKTGVVTREAQDFQPAPHFPEASRAALGDGRPPSAPTNAEASTSSKGINSARRLADTSFVERELVVSGSASAIVPKDKMLKEALAESASLTANSEAVSAVAVLQDEPDEQIDAEIAPTHFSSGAGAIVTGLSKSEYEAPKLGRSFPAMQDDDCVLADSELALAAKANAPADKLFHQRKALRLCPNSAKNHVAIAQTYQLLKRRSDAEYELREALRIEPQNAQVLTMLQDLK